MTLAQQLPSFASNVQETDTHYRELRSGLPGLGDRPRMHPSWQTKLDNELAREGAKILPMYPNHIWSMDEELPSSD